MSFEIHIHYFLQGIARTISKHSTLIEAEKEFSRLLNKPNRKRAISLWSIPSHRDYRLIRVSHDIYLMGL